MYWTELRRLAVSSGTASFYSPDVVEAHCCVKMNGSQLQEQNTQHEGGGGGGKKTGF